MPCLGLAAAILLSWSIAVFAAGMDFSCVRQAFIAEYARGLRVIIHTANHVAGDSHKVQGAWVQDFPWKERPL